jgi:RNA-directed DNA polymerase
MSLGKSWVYEPPLKIIKNHVSQTAECGYRLQKRIYRASARGNVQAVHRLQQLLTRSRSARLLAVRRVTQDNQGKKTAGIDGVASLTPPARLSLANAIHPNAQKRRKPRPVRRVWIPKPSAPNERRPLGIPVMEDRACQALAKQALEPEWEARFEPNSYGFRPGRGCHDAIGAIFQQVCHQAKYVLDADIKGAFDHLSHSALLDKLATYPAMRRTVKGWLTAGIMEAGVYSPSEEGAPQGGVLSPLLMNIALHGMETTLSEAFAPQEGKPALVRYADDLVVFHLTQAGVRKAWQVLEHWLRDIGLELKPSKTRVAHTLTPLQGRTGFDFLGVTVRQYAIGRTHSAKSSQGTPLGFKTLIKPSKEAIKRHVATLNQVVRFYQNASQETLIAHLNPIVKGWANYYQTVVAKEVFAQCDHLLYQRLRRWAHRRHPTKQARWIASKYWRVNQGEGWTFQAQNGSRLRRHAATPIKRHVKVKQTASPYDGNLVYWAQRLKDHPLTGTRTGILLKHQKGQCAYCGLYFKPGDLLEIDHVIPRRLGGDDRLMNLQVLHRHCHDQKTAKLDAAPAPEQAQVSMTMTI